MDSQNIINRNIAVVRSFYEGGTSNEGLGYGEIFADSFKVTAPDYLPWGGTSNLKNYLENILPQVTRVINFSSLKFDSIVGQNQDVVVIVNVGVLGTNETIKISEHWMMENGKALSLWVAYFEPQALINQIDKIKNAGNKNFINP